MDRLEQLDRWKQDLRQSSIAYCTADDAIKELNRELKPLRQTVKECSQRVMDLLTEHDERRCDIHTHAVSLRMDTRKSKKMPSKSQLRERCIEFAGTEDEGDRMFAFLTEPIVSERTRLLRKKLSTNPPRPAFTESVNEMLEELEPGAEELM